MRRQSVLVGVLVVGALTAPSMAVAQWPVTIGVAGGLTPTSGRNTRRFAYPSGAHAQISVEHAQVFGRLGIRADVFVNSFTRPAWLTGQGLSRRTSVPGASMSLVLPLSASATRVRPYLIAGAGTYRTDLGTGSESAFGLSGGGGLEVGSGRLRPYFEMRLHRIYDGGTPDLIPLTVGLRF